MFLRALVCFVAFHHNLMRWHPPFLVRPRSYALAEPLSFVNNCLLSLIYTIFITINNPYLFVPLRKLYDMEKKRCIGSVSIANFHSNMTTSS